MVVVVGLLYNGIYICQIVTISYLSCPAVIILLCPEDKYHGVTGSNYQTVYWTECRNYLPSIFSYLIPIKRRFQFDKCSDYCQFAFGNQWCFKYN